MEVEVGGDIGAIRATRVVDGAVSLDLKVLVCCRLLTILYVHVAAITRPPAAAACVDALGQATFDAGQIDEAQATSHLYVRFRAAVPELRLSEPLGDALKAELLSWAAPSSGCRLPM